MIDHKTNSILNFALRTSLSFSYQITVLFCFISVQIKEILSKMTWEGHGDSRHEKPCQNDSKGNNQVRMQVGRNQLHLFSYLRGRQL